MKNLAIVLLVILCTGCAAKIDGWRILKAEELCKDHAGIDHITFGVGSDWATCRDGMAFTIQSVFVKQ